MEATAKLPEESQETSLPGMRLRLENLCCKLTVTRSLTRLDSRQPMRWVQSSAKRRGRIGCCVGQVVLPTRGGGHRRNARPVDKRTSGLWQLPQSEHSTLYSQHAQYLSFACWRLQDHGQNWSRRRRFLRRSCRG